MSGLLDVGEVSTNPFSPDFGQPPQALVGREELLSSLRTGLNTGPSDPRFTSLVTGPRGSGKTVILTEIENIAAASGWIIMSVDAGTDGLLDRITTSIAQAKDSHEGTGQLSIGGRTNRAQWVGAIRLGPFEWHQQAFEPLRVEWDLRRQLTALAEHARDHGTAVLLTVDEIHSGDRDELRRLAGDLQHITKRAQLPLAFLGAGLSQVEFSLLADKKMTFLQRCERFAMPPLNLADAMRGLRQTVNGAGGSIEDDALRAAAQASGTLPYRLQLVGHNAWTIAGAPHQPIDMFAVSEAGLIATQQMTERLSIPAWHDLGATEQSVLAAVAQLGDDASGAQIAQQVDVGTRALAHAAERLIASGYLRNTADGLMALTDLMPTGLVQRMAKSQSRFLAAGRTDSLRVRVRASGSPGGCNAYMPRVKAYCVLPDNHAGGCRSRKRQR